VSAYAVATREHALLRGAIPVAAGALLLMLRGEALGLGEARMGTIALIYCLVALVSLSAPGGRAAAQLPALPVTLIGVVAVSAVATAPWQTPIGPGGGIAALGFGVLAAVAEEAFFRRVLYGWLLMAGTAVAVVGSALAFALIHLPLYGTSVLWIDFGAGLLLSWQRWASGHWAPSALTHSFANAVAVIR
jgi:membrane protease YdiL (CAAX protease family)